jgi:hypothetical protein
MNHISLRKLFSAFLIFFLFLFLQTISGIFAPVKLTLTPPYFKTQEVRAAGESWYNSSWPYRRQITIDHTKVASDEANFPVLISLDALSNIQANGTDIRFTSSDGTTELPREIESYSSGSLRAWVKVPALSSSTDTVLYVYYGNSSATTEPAAGSDFGSQNVWKSTGDTSTAMIQHMKDSPNTSHTADSTVNANNGTKYAANNPIATSSGQIDNAQSFNGTNSYINAGNGASLNITNAITIETWVNLNAIPSGAHWPAIIDKYSNYQFVIQPTTGKPYIQYTIGGAGQVTLSSLALVVGSWTHIAGVITNGSQTIYINGVSKGITTYTGSISTNSHNLLIGINNNGIDFVSGSIDETRIYSRALSAQEIITQYNNQSSPSTFYTLGSEKRFDQLDHFTITGAGTMIAGSSQTITITAKTDPGNTYTSYTGDKSLTFSGAGISGGGNNPTCSDKNNSDVNFGSSTTVTFTNGVATCTMKLYKGDEIAAINVTDGTITATGYTLSVAVSSFWLSFIDPTPNNNATIYYPNYAYLNTSVTTYDPANSLTGFIDCNNSLVGWWRFNNEAGESSTLFKDWSTYGNNGTCSGAACPVSATGKFGNALQFNGTTDYVDAGNGASLNITGAITIEAWVKTNTIPASGHWPALLDKNINYQLVITPTTGKPYLQWNNSGSGYNVVSNTALSIGVWAHIAVVVINGSQTLYFNGVKSGSASNPALLDTSTQHLLIGKNNGSNDFFNGSIDEVKIWNRALSPNEIKASYNVGLNKLYRKITSSTSNSYACAASVQDSQGTVSTETKSFNIVNDNSPYFLTAIGPAITNSKILPDTDLNTLYNNNKYNASSNISLQASNGEYTAASFVVSSNQDLTNLNITASDLTSGGNTIPASDIDIKAVKVWYQSGTDDVWRNQDLNVLTPELLLNDDSLVKVQGTDNYIKGYNCSGCYIDISQPRFPLKATDSAQWQTEENYLTANVKPTDAATLQPVNISANTLKQFWVTIHIPQDASIGSYTGAITLDSHSAFPTKTINLQTEVLPFNLEDPVLDYSIYYMSILSDTASLGETKSAEQIANEMRDLKAHGIDYPTIYEQDSNLSNYLTIRDDKGFKKDKLYYLRSITSQYDPNNPNAFKNSVAQYVNLFKSFGYGDTYMYGIDEAQGSALLAERPAFQAVHDAGAKNFVSCSDNDCYSSVGDLLDTGNIAGTLDSITVAQFHSVGHRTFNYANPQLGLEQPETYRRNYGLTLWKAGYDGALDYAYQSSFGGFAWNDFDDPTYKNITMAYPTMNGVIDTIEWEGFREGVDDVRYLSTLLKYINLAKAQTGNVHDLGVQAQNWVNSTDFTYGDLDQIRTDMITQTKNIYVALAALVTPTPTLTPTPITASTPSSSSTVTDYSTAPPTCGNTPPSSAPSLYTASAQDSSSVLLYFTDAGDPVSSYAVEYGTSPGSYQYSALSIGTKGTRTYLVSSLLPATTYYFRVRGGNGCAAGSWSNEISAKTKGLISFNQLDITQSELESKPVEETPPATTACKTYTVKSGDGLWSIAENLLGDGNRYKEIIEQNKDKYQSLETSNNLEAGWELKVNCGKQTTLETQNTPATGTQGGYDVKVKVVDTNKKPVEGAKVTIHSKVQETVTNKDGIAQFKNVEAGNHKVLIAYNNFEGEQSVNLTGNVKEFDLNVTVQQKAISLSPLAYGIIGIMGLVVIGLAVLLIKAKRKV